MDLNKTRDDAAGGTGPGAEDLDQPQPVNRMNHVRVPDDASGFVHLQLADEVPARSWIQVIAFGSLARRLLVPVLADVGHAELDEKPHVGGRGGVGALDQCARGTRWPA